MMNAPPARCGAPPIATQSAPHRHSQICVPLNTMHLGPDCGLGVDWVLPPPELFLVVVEPVFSDV